VAGGETAETVIHDCLIFISADFMCNEEEAFLRLGETTYGKLSNIDKVGIAA
jgi:hypothetical protein